MLFFMAPVITRALSQNCSPLVTSFRFTTRVAIVVLPLKVSSRTRAITTKNLQEAKYSAHLKVCGRILDPNDYADKFWCS